MSLVVVHTGSMEYKLYSSGEIRLTIPASDWIQDCQRQLGLGKHVIIESSLPDLESTELPKMYTKKKKPWLTVSRNRMKSWLTCKMN